MNQVNTHFPKESLDRCQKAMTMLKEGKIRNHKLGNNAPLHDGDNSDCELYLYQDFLPTGNFYSLISLRGRRVND